jgi:hydrogenase-4 component F
MDTTTITLVGPVVAPIAGAAFAAVTPRRVAAWTSALAAAALLAAGIALAQRTAHGTVVAAGLLRADALTAWLLIAVGAVATIACWAGVHHLGDRARAGTLTGRSARRYLVLVQLFLACMSVAVLAANLGLLWVAIEATTVVTAFLVGHQRTRASIEAAWKYVVLCSVGVGIAFLGTICVYAAAIGAGSPGGLAALDWTNLNANAAALDPSLMRLAAGLVLLGFGTKAGLAPMHAWLPDAHSQAPAPVSALMSGVLLSVAFYAIVRYKTVFDAVLGPGYVRTLLLIAGLASLALAAALLIGQRDYKRLLAYSSIEHMGLVALGTAIGGRLALAAVLLHILGHGLAKAVAFCGAGEILHRVGSPSIAAVRGALALAPTTMGLFGLALVALLGLPPFALFASELALTRAGFAAGLGWAVAAALVLVLVAFAAIVRHAGDMLLGASTVDRADAGTASAGARWLPLALGLVAAMMLGIWLGPLQSLLDSASLIAAGEPR